MNDITANITDELVKSIAGDNVSNLELDAESNIMVIGVGGAGGNAVNYMYQNGITGVNFVVCNTDAKALNNCDVKNKVQMGPGLGAGNDPSRGKELAIESEEQLRSLLETSGVKMLFIAAGMGGGTGTGASPVIAKLAHELKILTVAVVTMPFRLEGPVRYTSALEGIKELNEWVDSILIIDNERLRMLYGRLPLKEAFGKADDVLNLATKGIAEIITVEEALVRVDFADVKKVMHNSGRAHMSMVKATGENRALEVAEAALSSSLLDDNNINGAKEILLNFAVKDMGSITQDDITVAMECIQKHASYRDEDGNIVTADIIWGACEKPSLEEDELELVVVATRFTDGKKLQVEQTFNEPTPITLPEPDDLPNVPDNIGNIGNINKQPISIPRPEVKITPQHDKYKRVELQKREPAYKRLCAQFEVDSDTQQKVNYQQQRATREEPTTTDAGGTLFQ